LIYSREAIRRVTTFRYYYGWNIVFVGFLSTVVSGLGVYTLAIFVGPMTAAFGWSRTIISIVQTIQTVGNGIAAPFVGPFLDRRGPRLLMVVGGVLAGASLILTSQVEAAWQFYVFRGLLFALGMAFMGPFVTSTTISKFFIRMRGRAIAISAMGLSFAGVIVPPLAATMIDRYGWQAAWVALGLTIWVVAVAPGGLIMRRNPEDLGLRPDGDTAEGMERRRAEATARGSEVWASEGAIWTRRTLLRCPTFWLVVLAFGLSSLAMQGIFLHMIPFIQEEGYSLIAAASAFTAQNFMAFVTKPVWGLIAERATIRYAAAVEFAFGGIGLLGVYLSLTVVGSLALAYVFAGVIGLSIGGVVVNHELVWGNSFGRQSLGLVRGTGQPFTIVSSAVGPLVGGLLYDLTGSYAVGMPIYVASYAVAVVVILFARPPRYEIAKVTAGA
jgi:MFS transporter, OFA family, oxalate/formate antiporter